MTTRRLERLTASDMFLLMWDDYGWSTDIGALAMLEGERLLDPDGRVRVDEVRRHLAPRVALVPRFRQRLLRPRLGLGWPLWVDAAAFDIGDHVRVLPLPAPATEDQLLRACEELAARPLDRGRPLWELWLLPGLPDRRVGAFLKLHHVIADGAAAAAAFGSLLDLSADAPAPDVPVWTPGATPTSVELLRDNLLLRWEQLRRGGGALIHPARTLRVARQTLPAWREVLAERPAPHTSLNRPVGTDRRLALVRSHLDLAKQVAHGHQAKVNDVVLAVVAGGLRQLLAGRAEGADDLVQRAMVTITEHQPGPAQGNKPGWMMVPLPVGDPDPVRRLRLVAGETAERKRRARPEAGSGVFRFLAGQRVWYRMFPRQRSVNLVVSNVPGPPVPLYLAGARVLEVFPMMPPMGNLTLVVAALSYAGQLNLTAAADRDSLPDLEEFVDGVREALRDLERSVPAATAG